MRRVKTDGKMQAENGIEALRSRTRDSYQFKPLSNSNFKIEYQIFEFETCLVGLRNNTEMNSRIQKSPKIAFTPAQGLTLVDCIHCKACPDRAVRSEGECEPGR